MQIALRWGDLQCGDLDQGTSKMRYFRLAVMASLAALGSSAVFAQQSSSNAINQSASYLNVSEKMPGGDEKMSQSLGRDCDTTQACGCNGCGCGCRSYLGTCCGDALWEVNAGGVALTRTRPQSSQIIRQATTPNATLLDASDINFDWAIGPDISIVRRLCDCRAFQAVDFRYFGVWNVQGNRDTNPDTAWQFPNTTVFGATSVSTSYETQLHSVELNVLRDSPLCRLTWLAGFRWVQLKDDLDNGVLIETTARNRYDYRTENNLYGGQVGAMIRLLDTCGPLQITLVPKAGIYATTVRNEYTAPAIAASNRDDRASFVGDVGVLATYCVTEHLSVQGGYQLLWVDGVAVGGSQPAALNPNTQEGINSSGSAFYHGATAGVTFCW